MRAPYNCRFSPNSLRLAVGGEVGSVGAVGSLLVGDTDGDLDGLEDGLVDGLTDGLADGLTDGLADGLSVGATVGGQLPAEVDQLIVKVPVMPLSVPSPSTMKYARSVLSPSFLQIRYGQPGSERQELTIVVPGQLPPHRSSQLVNAPSAR